MPKAARHGHRLCRPADRAAGPVRHRPTDEEFHMTTARLFIGGEFRPSDKAQPVIEAATGEPLGDGSAATESEIDAAVAAARAALDGWRTTPAAERATMLHRFADALRSRAAQTNELCTRENGMPISQSRGANGAFPAALLRYYANMITSTDAE